MSFEGIGLEHPLPEAKGPAEGQEAFLPSAHDYAHVTEADLDEAAKAIFPRRPLKAIKGGNVCCFYINGWGGGQKGKANKKSKGFKTKAGLAQAIADWCPAVPGDRWDQRVKVD